jgi:hypothetical protein
MRKRAYRPEVHDCLEDRALLSGTAGLAADPVVFSRHNLVFITDHVRNGFTLFARYRDMSQLRAEIDDVVPDVPFERVDGLESSIVRILHRMRHDLRAKVPNAFRTARNDVIGVLVANVQAHVRAGDMVMR